MSENKFIPNLNVDTETKQQESPVTSVSKEDVVSKMLLRIAQYSVLSLFALTPIFFVPGLWASLGLGKVVYVLTTCSIILITLSLMALRSSRVSTVLPLSLGLYWFVVLMAFISAMSSGDVMDSLRGNYLEVQTVGFLAVLGLLMTVPLVFKASKSMTVKAILLFGASAGILIIYNLVRLVFGADFLPMGSFSAVTTSPIGGFNDLAIFSGLVVILSLITLVQLPLNVRLQSLVSILIFASILILMVINFFNIWLIVGFFSLLVLVYLISKDSFLSKEVESSVGKQKLIPIVVAALISVTCAVFVISGDYAGGAIAKIVDAEYTEILPSREGTIGIAKAVYEENAILGVGPNRFGDAWRLYKDPTINQTIFWDTDFNSGSGFIPTLFVTMGLLGGIFLLAFHVWFLYLGYRMLLKSDQDDSYWYYVGSVSFAAACFIWGTAYIYEPKTAVLMIGALFTGLTFVAAGQLLPNMTRTIPLVTNQRRGFFMMAIVIVVISNMTILLTSVSKQYTAQSSFNQVRATAESIEEFELAASNSYELYADDRFMIARAQIKLNEINGLLAKTEPTEEDRQKFLSNVEQALIFTEVALSQDSSNPDNHAVLASVYGALAIAGVDGAKEKNLATLSDAQNLNPMNPGYHLVAAQIAVRTGDFELAKSELSQALSLKSNFTEALFISAQIDISEENTVAAIEKTRSIISLEPNNPTRYFQLGMLLSAEKDYQGAITSFERAVSLDNEYANARYLLALAYVAVEEPEKALAQLRIVEETNPENQQLITLISQVESGEATSANLGFDTPVDEVEPETVEDSAVTSDRGEDTTLVDSVNTLPLEDKETEGVVEEVEAPVVDEETETEEVLI
jgi:tetratricopeptide (TPR) repeat protein